MEQWNLGNQKGLDHDSEKFLKGHFRIPGEMDVLGCPWRSNKAQWGFMQPSWYQLLANCWCPGAITNQQELETGLDIQELSTTV